MDTDISDREATNSCMIVSTFFSYNPVMDKSCKEKDKEKQSFSKKPQVKSNNIQKRPVKKLKGQKDIRTLIKSKKNELLKYTKDFDLICKQSGIDVDPEQLQLAIALSKSLQNSDPTNDEFNTSKSLTYNQRRRKIRTTLQEYGFKTKNSPVKKLKGHRKHYDLFLISDLEKKQRIASKYAQILIKNIDNYKVDKVCLNNTDNINSKLFNLTTSATYDCIKDDRTFYINDLVPISYHTKHMFKDWSRIPGRPESPKFETSDISFKCTDFSQAELDEILSGLIERAQVIVKKKYRCTNTFEAEIIKGPSFTETNVNQENTDTNNKRCKAEEFSINKPIDDNIFSRPTEVIKYNNLNNMSLPNRSYSPDLFDDEVTIIMDNPKDTTLFQDRVCERITMVKEQNVSMDITKCVDIVKSKCTESLQNIYLSQGSNKSNSNFNEFMDLTECVPTCFQNDLDNSYITDGENSCKKYSLIKGNNHEVIDLNHCPNISSHNQPSTCSKDKSFDDTIIMIDEEIVNVTSHTNTGNKYIMENKTSKETAIIDLVESQYKNTKMLHTLPNHNSIIDLERSFEKDDKNSKKHYKLDNKQDNDPVKNISRFSVDENKKLCNKTVDLTIPNFEDSLSLVNVIPTKSFVTCEIQSESDSASNNEKSIRNNNKEKSKCDTFEAMDLTQSSNSGNGIQEDAQVICVDNKFLDDTIELKKEDCIISFNSDHVNNTRYDEIVDLVNFQNSISEQDKHYDNNLITGYVTVGDAELNTKKQFTTSCGISVPEFVNEIENLSSGKDNNTQTTATYIKKCVSISFDECKFVDQPNKQQTNVTEHYDCNTNQFAVSEKLCNKLGNHTDYALTRCHSNKSDSHDIELYEYENEPNIENNKIDLTQQPDEDITYSSKYIQIPDDLGKYNNISVDYDEGCDPKTNIDDRTTSSISNMIVEKDKDSEKDECVSSSSQYSEVFELIDNEFNYSIEQHVKNKDSLTLKAANFDIGGISVIDEFLDRNSLPRSKLRCSCHSTNDPSSMKNKVESCLPVTTLLNSGNFFGNQVNNYKESFEKSELVKISTPIKAQSGDNVLIAKTPSHDNYIIKTDQVTPMPNYERMTSPERNEELDRYGIKPLKRKRAIQMLTHIYNQTHPLMELISNDEYSSPTKRRRKNNVESFPSREIPLEIDPVMAKRSTEPPDRAETSKPLSQKSKQFKNSQNSRTQSSRKDNNMYEETTSMPDIKNIECSPEDWVFQKREKAKVHSCKVPLHIAFHNYVSCRKALREAILKYEPINIDDIHKGLVAIGYRYDPKDLLKFMDRKCITVKTADNLRKKQNT